MALIFIDFQRISLSGFGSILAGDYPTVLGADSTRAQWYYGPIVLGVDGPMPLKSRAH